MLAKQPLSQLSYGPILVKPQTPAGTSVPLGFRAMGRGGRSALPNLTVREAGEHNRSKVQMVGLGRLERPTSPLSGVRSNHLSYRPRVIERASPTAAPITLSGMRRRNEDGAVPHDGA